MGKGVFPELPRRQSLPDTRRYFQKVYVLFRYPLEILARAGETRRSQGGVGELRLGPASDLQSFASRSESDVWLKMDPAVSGQLAGVGYLQFPKRGVVEGYRWH